MTESEKELFSKRLYVRQVLISADFFVTPVMTESAAVVDIIVPDSEYRILLELYNRICQFSLLHGEDLQELFQTNKYIYMSCFIRDVAAFKSEFECEEVLEPLFNHGKGETAMFVISFPKKPNFGNKELINDSFISIIQKHVVQINDSEWQSFVERASSGTMVDFGIDLATGASVDLDNERGKIIKLTREEFIKSNIADSFEPDFYVNRLFRRAERIGEIDGHSVWFNSRGFYFYWNEETEYLLESWLTYPAYPYEWFK